MGDEKEVSENTLMHYKDELLQKLPLERETFLMKFAAANLLPEGSGEIIRSINKRKERVSYLLEHVVEPAAEVYLPMLIDVMQTSDDIAVKNLAKNMQEYKESSM